MWKKFLQPGIFFGESILYLRLASAQGSRHAFLFKQKLCKTKNALLKMGEIQKPQKKSPLTAKPQRCRRCYFENCKVNVDLESIIFVSMIRLLLLESVKRKSLLYIWCVLSVFYLFGWSTICCGWLPKY